VIYKRENQTRSNCRTCDVTQDLTPLPYVTRRSSQEPEPAPIFQRDVIMDDPKICFSWRLDFLLVARSKNAR